MGTTFAFRCSRCDLYAEVSGKGDAGELCSTETMYCHRCANLRDVIDMRRRDLSRPRKVQKRCPTCRGTNLTLWRRGQPCPRCGGRIINQGCVALWD